MNTSTISANKKLNLSYGLSILIALLMAGVSTAGLVFQSSFYPTEALRGSFVSNDMVNLIIGLPILLGSMWLARRGHLIGLLFWLGALFYILYNYIAYAVATSQMLAFCLYLGLVFLSVYTMFGLFLIVDLTAIQNRLIGTVPERLAGGVLVGLGTLFFVRGVAQVAGSVFGHAALARPDLAVQVADLITTPAWIVGGLLLWRRQAFGYASGAGLLFQASMLFIGLLSYFILQPFLAAMPFPLTDFVVIFVMGLVCFIPLVIFVRALLMKRK